MRGHAPGHQTRGMDYSSAPVYEICVRGSLGATMLSAFPGLSGEAHDGVTVLSGRLVDQSALHGVLGQVESLGLELLAVRQVAPKYDAPGRVSRRH
jgi:hypothetical protein